MYLLENLKCYLLLFLLLSFFSCRTPLQVEEYYSLKNEKWCREDAATFRVDIPQPGRYLVSLCVRHTTDYELANLWCFVSLRDSSQNLLRDTVNLQVAESNGRWLGKGHSLKTLEQPVTPRFMTLPKGTITVRIEQGMRIDCLNGLKDIGFKITHVQ